MAKYDVKFSCGHVETIQLYGKESDRQRKIAWLEEHGECSACYKARIAAERAADTAAAADKAAEENLPTLTGSEKQVNWALSIRAKKFADLEKMLANMTTADEQLRRQNQIALQATKNVLASKTDSKFWIDNRNVAANRLIADNNLQEDLKAEFARLTAEVNTAEETAETEEVNEVNEVNDETAEVSEEIAETEKIANVEPAEDTADTDDTEEISGTIAASGGIAIIGYKGFDKDFRDNDFSCPRIKYEVGKTYKHAGSIAVYESGIHFFENPLDVLIYYAPTNSRFALVEAKGNIDADKNIFVASEITIVKELTLDELINCAIKNGLRVTNVSTNTRNDNSGSFSNIIVTGDQSIAVATGKDGKAKGALGSWIVLSEWHLDKIIDVQSFKVDGVNIKPDVFYRLVNGKPVAQDTTA